MSSGRSRSMWQNELREIEWHVFLAGTKSNLWRIRSCVGSQCRIQPCSFTLRDAMSVTSVPSSLCASLETCVKQLTHTCTHVRCTRSYLQCTGILSLLQILHAFPDWSLCNHWGNIYRYLIVSKGLGRMCQQGARGDLGKIRR